MKDSTWEDLEVGKIWEKWWSYVEIFTKLENTYLIFMHVYMCSCVDIFAHTYRYYQSIEKRIVWKEKPLVRPRLSPTPVFGNVGGGWEGGVGVWFICFVCVYCMCVVSVCIYVGYMYGWIVSVCVCLYVVCICVIYVNLYIKLLCLYVYEYEYVLCLCMYIWCLYMYTYMSVCMYLWCKGKKSFRTRKFNIRN